MITNQEIGVGSVANDDDREDVVYRLSEDRKFEFPSREEYDKALKYVANKIKESREKDALKKSAGRKPNELTTKPRNIDLVVMMNTGRFPDRFKHYDVPVNDIMDKEKDSGVIIARYRRECQKCQRQFIGMGQFNRRCYACKNSKELN